MNHVKHQVLEASAPALRAGLARIPGAYFQVASETVDDPADREAVLERLLELFALSVEKLRGRSDAAEAALAEARRRHLRLIGAEII